MSKYLTVDLEMTDSDCLKSAIAELGYVCEEHETPQGLNGYRGDLREQKAHIIIRRNQISSASNDLGFLKKSDGTFEMIISEYDRSVLGRKEFQQKLTQSYGKHKFLKQAKKMGFTVKSQKVDNKGLIKIKVTRY